jgi:hypothetical protein
VALSLIAGVRVLFNQSDFITPQLPLSKKTGFKGVKSRLSQPESKKINQRKIKVL